MTQAETTLRYCPHCGNIVPQPFQYASGLCSACHASNSKREGKRLRAPNGIRKSRSGTSKGQYVIVRKEVQS